MRDPMHTPSSALKVYSHREPCITYVKVSLVFRPFTKTSTRLNTCVREKEKAMINKYMYANASPWVKAGMPGKVLVCNTTQRKGGSL